MPRRKNAVPSYLHHKQSGQARCRINGKDFLLGPYGSDESKQAYRQLLDRWTNASSPATFGVTVNTIVMDELIVAWDEHAKLFYGTGKGSEQPRYRPLYRAVRSLYKHLPTDEFGPKEFKAVRMKLIRKGDSLDYINKQMQRLKRMFKWAGEEELVKGETVYRLDTVRRLTEGDYGVEACDDIEPIAVDVVERTIKILPEVVADMVQIQTLTGARPGEVCRLTPGMFDRSGDVWVAKLQKHKTSKKRKRRFIFFGPQAQSIVRPYLLRSSSSPLFSPKESEAKRRAKLTAQRVTPDRQGNRVGTNRKSRPGRTPGNAYTTDSYRRCINTACEREGIEKWNPNRLRHTRATYLRMKFGLEAAAAILGHSNIEATQIYAEQQFNTAVAAMRQVG